MRKFHLAFFALLALTALSSAMNTRVINQPPAGFFTEIQALLDKAKGKYASNPNDVFNTPVKIVDQVFSAERIAVKVMDGKSEREWSFTPHWDNSYPFGIFDARNSKGKNVKCLRAYHDRKEVEVYFLKKDVEKMQAILDKYTIKD